MNIIIDGNIGSGKSTVLEYLRSRFNNNEVEIYIEPVDKWSDLNGVNLLDKYYQDPKRWSFHFQMYALYTFHDQILKTLESGSEPRIRLFERSMFSSKYVFLENLKQLKLIDQEGYDIFNNLFENIINREKRIKIDKIIYLKAPTDFLMNRIKKRNRAEERNISFEYVDNLNKLYDSWFSSKMLPTSVLQIFAVDSCGDDNINKDVYNFLK